MGHTIKYSGRTSLLRQLHQLWSSMKGEQRGKKRMKNSSTKEGAWTKPSLIL